MAVCPECQTPDKPFFAARCYQCNTLIGFWNQVLTSLTLTVIRLIGAAVTIWFLWNYLFFPG